MVEIHIAADEAYPVYYFVEGPSSYYDTTAEIDEETLARWRKAADDYNQMQADLAALCCFTGGSHKFKTITFPDGETRTYCPNCHTDKGETLWDVDSTPSD